ncbi:sigma-70 family RNA polymerase sigma factor [Hansschlegelia plantiphila]|uniref:RNA polymerase sigma factor n=1 Tax=Hansschlegelia plantiphila TaxID=374655 RepID=A0A9W6MVP2_9HYPH|nr:sigma-70 family RNA polymerase sigma factor [Hansschlegelia plantiphila]GLK68188.1 RNA polymerase sigma factor [Hansschlegelia plantiphila]
MTEASDEALIGRIAAGDRAAMRILYGRHSTRTLRFLIRLVRNEATAEDLMSDVYFDVWRQAERFEGRSSVSTWILSIARFKALSALRRVTERPLEPKTADAVEDSSDTPETTALKASKADAMRRCLAALSLEHREVIDLVYYHERSVEEASDILGVPAATVKTRMFYARKKLSDLLSAAGVDRGWP